jgi:hypothetical protein
MNLPFRRRSRTRGAARLAPAGDFPATSESATDILDRVRPADWDGTTIEFSGASGPGLPPDAIYGPAPASPDGTVAVTPEWWRP